MEAAQSPKPLFRRRWFQGLAALLLLLSLVLAALPYAIGYGLQRWLLDHGAEAATIGDVEFNPFAGDLVLHDVRVTSGGKRLVLLPEVSLRVGWEPLWQRRLWLERVTIRGADLQVVQGRDGRWRVGIPLPAAAEPAAASGAPWGFGTGRVILEKCHLSLDTPRLKARLDIDRAELYQLRSWRVHQPARLTFAGRLNGAPLAVQASTEPFAPTPNLDGHLQLSGLDLSRFAALGGPAVKRLAGRIDADTELRARLGDGAVALVQKGTLKLADFELADSGGRAAAKRLHWSGELDTTFGAGHDDAIHLRGSVDAAGARLRRGAPALEAKLDSLIWKGRAAAVLPRGSTRWQLAQEGRLQLRRMALTAAASHFSGETVDWQGALNLPGPGFEASGSLHGKTLAYDDGRTRAASASLAWNGELRGTTAQGGSRVAQKGRLQAGGLMLDAPAVQLDERELDWNGKLEATGGKAASASAEGKLSAAGPGLTLPGEKLRIDHGALNWSGRAALAGNALDALSGSLAVADLGLGRNGATLITAKSLALKDLSGKESRLAAGQLRLQQLVLLPGTAAASPPLLRAATLSSSGLAFSTANGLDLGRLTLSNATAHLQRGKRGTWQELQRLPAASTARTAPAAKGKPADALPLRLAGLQLAGQNRIEFRDDQVDPPFHADVRLESLSVGAADSRQPDRATPVSVKGRIGDYGKFQLSGDIQPFAARATLHLAGAVENLDLPPLSGYARRELGYDLTSGHLTAGVQVNIDQGKLSGDNTLKFNQLQVAPADRARMAQLSTQLSMPLDSALALLRDSDDNIKLHVPLGGDVADPKFGYADAINQALGKAMKTTALTYLKYYFQPYGTLIAIAELADKAMAVRLDPLDFAPGSSVLDPKATAYLDKVGGLLRQRPQLRLRLCGKAVAADAAALAKAAPGKEAQGVAGDPLTILAKARAVAIRDFLVNKFGIKPERLFLCLPEAKADAKGKPRVELLI